MWNKIKSNTNHLNKHFQNNLLFDYYFKMEKWAAIKSRIKRQIIGLSHLFINHNNDNKIVSLHNPTYQKKQFHFAFVRNWFVASYSQLHSLSKILWMLYVMEKLLNWKVTTRDTFYPIVWYGGLDFMCPVECKRVWWNHAPMLFFASAHFDRNFLSVCSDCAVVFDLWSWA